MSAHFSPVAGCRQALASGRRHRCRQDKASGATAGGAGASEAFLMSSPGRSWMEVATARGVDPDELGELHWGDEASGEPIASSGAGASGCR